MEKEGNVTKRGENEDMKTKKYTRKWGTGNEGRRERGEKCYVCVKSRQTAVTGEGKAREGERNGREERKGGEERWRGEGRGGSVGGWRGDGREMRGRG